MISTGDDGNGDAEGDPPLQETLNVDIEPIKQSPLGGISEQDEKELSDADREILNEFETEMENLRARVDRFGESHQETLIHSCGKLAAKVGGLKYLLEDGEELETVVTAMAKWIDNAEFAPNTKQSFLSSVRVFAHLMLPDTDNSEFDDTELPEVLENLDPGKYTRDLDPAPKKSEIISYQEAIEMAKAQDNPRDSALIMLMWSIGLRPYSELHKLRFKHFHDCGTHYEVTVPSDGKTGSRVVRLFVAAPLVRRWLEQEHPALDDPEADAGPETHVWTHHNKNEWLCYGSVAAVFDRAAEKAGMADKKTCPQNFRRSSASYCAGRPMTDEGNLRQRYGWGKQSSAPHHYISRFGDDQDVIIAGTYGMDVDIEPKHKPTGPIECDRCGEWTERGLDTCVWCREPVDKNVMTMPKTSHPKADHKGLMELIVDDEIKSSDFESAKKLEGEIRSNPRFWEKIDEFKRFARQNEQSDDDDDVDEALAVTGVGTAGAWVSARASTLAAHWARTKHRVLSLHPQYEHYPPSPSRAAAGGVAIAAWILFMATVIVPDVTSGVLAGEASSVGILLFGLLVVGTYAVLDLPTMEDVPA